MLGKVAFIIGPLLMLGKIAFIIGPLLMLGKVSNESVMAIPTNLDFDCFITGHYIWPSFQKS